uniref:Putative membrane protein n=1 Tax=uncultured bacterium Lac36W TaxID=1403001 RepID=A0A059Q9K6_9BACT|nr:putative membrane protein [uncultured bacterium Lac36W]
MMFAMAGACFLLARRWPPLLRRPLLFGATYGLILYAVMTYVVVPLSAAGASPKDASWIACSIAMHILVGVLCAWFARRALSSRRLSARRRAPSAH